ncbi:hypothetical protein EYZ11_012325 [Aspergillus tanneri]|uniref:Carrier domain-containing protein n=1 Tax=Aspergillus tanneri TaxID=1220188 RepID=A0A4S3J0I0_9EURO|nr:hypothetical protein EYZ11_012325 [Aspergillus tanneri]
MGLMYPAWDSPDQCRGYTTHAIYALFIFCHTNDASNDLNFIVHFDERVLSHEKVLQLLGLLEFVLRQVCCSPKATLSEIDLVSPNDWKQLARWNAAIPPAHETTLHEMVLKFRGCQPDKPAVSTWDGGLSYLEIDDVSANLARLLMERGIEIGDLVGVCLEKSRWATVVLLAVLRAGGACVMLDPGLPRGRVEEMIRRSMPKIVLATETQNGLVSDLDTPVTLITDMFMQSLPREDKFCLPSDSSSCALFVLFTSGSTGTPKALVLEHRNLCTSIRDHRSGMNISGESRGLHFAAYAFDISIYEVFNVLSCGASFMRPEDVSCLETLVLSGEAVKQENVEVWASKVMLVNLYGPAEATACTVGRIPPVGWIPGTIGSMVGGVGWVCVPSNASQLAPVGTIGELVIEGFARATEPSLGCTGPETWCNTMPMEQSAILVAKTLRPSYAVNALSLGRSRPGFTVHGQEELMPAEVIVAESFVGNASLVVFIHEHRNYDEEGDEDAVSDDRPLFKKPIKAFRESAAVVETRLHEVIPRYMVPSLFIPVHEMPKTATGKMNRRLLREEASRLSREDILLYRVTRGSMGKVTTKTEEILQGIWARILSLPAKVIGVDDDFFGLGGDLISAMTLAAMARSQGLALTVADIFDNSALNKQAARTRSTSLFSINATPFSLVEVGESGNALLSSLVRIGIFYTVASANFTFYFVGNIDVGRLEQACASVFAKHEILRTLFISYRDTLVQVILRDIQCPFHHTADVEDLTTATKALYDQGAGRHITEVGLPLRYTLLSNLPQSQHIFSIRISHAQYDGVCLRLLCDQIQAAYNDLTKFASAPPETDFSSFMYYRRQQVNKEALDFWRTYLDGASMTLPPGLDGGIRQDAILMQIRDICSLSPPPGITDATLIMASVAAALSKAHDSQPLVLGQTGHALVSSLCD